VRGLVLLSVVLLSLGPAEARGEGVIVALGDSLTAGLGVRGGSGARATPTVWSTPA